MRQFLVDQLTRETGKFALFCKEQLEDENIEVSDSLTDDEIIQLFEDNAMIDKMTDNNSDIHSWHWNRIDFLNELLTTYDLENPA